MSDNKQEGKKYTQEEMSKALLEAEVRGIEKFISQYPAIDIHIGTNSYNSAPEVSVKITGGDMEKVRELGMKLSQMMLDNSEAIKTTDVSN